MSYLEEGKKLFQSGDPYKWSVELLNKVNELEKRLSKLEVSFPSVSVMSAEKKKEKALLNEKSAKVVKVIEIQDKPKMTTQERVEKATYGTVKGTLNV